VLTTIPCTLWQKLISINYLNAFQTNRPVIALIDTGILVAPIVCQEMENWVNIIHVKKQISSFWFPRVCVFLTHSTWSENHGISSMVNLEKQKRKTNENKGKFKKIKIKSLKENGKVFILINNGLKQCAWTNGSSIVLISVLIILFKEHLRSYKSLGKYRDPWKLDFVIGRRQQSINKRRYLLHL